MSGPAKSSLPKRVLRRIFKANRDQVLDLLELPTWVAESGLRPCFSQEGEDMILERIFGNKSDGFYVDIGAHHPIRYSSTYAFYLRNWRGINVDALPGRMREFEAHRPRDINIEAAVSDEPKELLYHCFDEPALNTFDAALAQDRVKSTPYKLVSTQPIRTQRLEAILEKYLPPGQAIDFLNVDVEGLDLQVLRSNDWNRFRPKVVVTEDLHVKPLAPIESSDTLAFMKSVGFELVARTVYTLFFVDRKRELSWQ